MGTFSFCLNIPLAQVPAPYREASGILTSGPALPTMFTYSGPITLGATAQSEESFILACKTFLVS